MKLLSLSAIATILAMSALPSPQTVRASTGIQRCVMADGNVAYTDRACGAYGAKTAPIPGGMMTRLLKTMPAEPAGHAAALQTIARREPSAGCARSPAQLEADLRGSFALRDANRIAESYHWVGLSNAQGQRIMDRLQSLGARPIRDTHFFSAQIASFSMPDAPISDESMPDEQASRVSSYHAQDADGTLQLLLGGPTMTAIDLDVEKYAGCYFVRFV